MNVPTDSTFPSSRGNRHGMCDRRENRTTWRINCQSLGLWSSCHPCGIHLDMRCPSPGRRCNTTLLPIKQAYHIHIHIKNIQVRVSPRYHTSPFPTRPSRCPAPNLFCACDRTAVVEVTPPRKAAALASTFPRGSLATVISCLSPCAVAARVE